MGLHVGLIITMYHLITHMQYKFCPTLDPILFQHDFLTGFFQGPLSSSVPSPFDLCVLPLHLSLQAPPDGGLWGRLG